MPRTDIVILGAAEHNLKRVDLRIPRDALTTITGVSGSGKSSLGFDTLYREGQRRFLESLSAYARQFLGQMEKPRVDRIEGLSPAISIDQKNQNRNPRSTVGTITEIFDHLRLLYARLGEPHCPKCGRRVTPQTADQIAEQVMAAARPEGSPSSPPAAVMLLAPIVRERKGEYRKELQDLRQRGFVRARIDGEVRRLEDVERLDRYKRHTIELIVDRISPSPDKRSRLAEGIEVALREGRGVLSVLIGNPGRLLTYGSALACPECSVSLPEMEPRLFSFNTPQGACPKCRGVGSIVRVAEDRIVPNPSHSIRAGALAPLGTDDEDAVAKPSPRDLEPLARRFGFSLDTPWHALEPRIRRIVLRGSGSEPIEMGWRQAFMRRLLGKEAHGVFPGIVPILEKLYRVGWYPSLVRFMAEEPCEDCGGARLRPESLRVTFRGKSIADVSRMSVGEAVRFFGELTLSPRESQIGRDIFREIRARLGFLHHVGLEYLSLDRSAATLAGGAAQRIRLAAQVGSGLEGVLYVLDEPSIGLHPRDHSRLLETLHRLRDIGNTVIVVEHDPQTMAASDFVVDLGPGAGALGGEVIEAGAFAKLLKNRRSLTGRYLRGDLEIPIPVTRRTPGAARLAVVGARAHNLKDLTVEIPLGCFVAVTGVSGSGKSTLVHDVLRRALAQRLHRSTEVPGAHREIRGIERLDKVIEIDQTPIGRTPRSNPATYTKIFDDIRRLFSQVPESRMRGYGPGRFSFNAKGGRCEACEGAGVRLIEMPLLAPVEVSCEECGGRRFNEETLSIRYGGKTIHDILGLSIEEALAFFAAVPRIRRGLETLAAVGLGYVKLGQTSTTLSGGEAQRVKLAAELGRPDTGRTLYLLDEPTTGLHFHDIQKLLDSLQRLVDKGNTVLAIEHNLEVVKVADWVLDLGPEGGGGGGCLVAEGPPEAIAASPASHTGRALRPILERRSGAALPMSDEHGNGAAEARETEPSSSPGAIVIEGARTHNLRGISVRVPHRSLTVFTGVSGSGKTSLAFDTIFAEGQRRFVESLSTYARRFLGRLDRAPVDRIDGLAPAIAIDAKSSSRSLRSTVSTATETYDFLRLLYARVGRAHCPTCDAELVAHTPSTAAAAAVSRLRGETVTVLAPLYLESLDSKRRVLADRSKPAALLDLLRKDGFTRVLLDGQETRLEGESREAGRRAVKRDLHLVIDRVSASPAKQARLAESLEHAFARGNGIGAVRRGSGEILYFSRDPGCVPHGIFETTELEPRLFSFNSWQGACPRCFGLGETRQADPVLLVRRPDLPLFGADEKTGAQALFFRGSRLEQTARRVAERLGADLDQPFADLPEAVRHQLLHGPTQPRGKTEFPGLLRAVEEACRDGRPEAPGKRDGKDRDAAIADEYAEVLKDDRCPECGGGRLVKRALRVRVGGKNISEACALTVTEALAFFDEASLDLDRIGATIAWSILQEIGNRLRFLSEVGLDYLTLDRSAATLSGGEAQRIRLATQIGSRLVGVLYVLDEPTIGLHPRDVDQLLSTLEELRDLGNTLVVVEHDESSIRRADHVVDMGPGAGHRGGEIVFSGTPADLLRDEGSLTARYLNGVEQIPAREERRAGLGSRLVVHGARAHNLKGIDVAIPLGTLTVVSGVSGSGKSSLVMEVIRRGVTAALLGAPLDRALASRIEGVESIRRLVVVEQSPIGKTPASNPATYTGAFDPIRELFATLPVSRVKGFTPSRFSFNSGDGRCAACSGRGAIRVEMHFLSDVWMTCDACGGRRYDEETLRVEYQGKTIADVLDLEVREALELFKHVPRVVQALRPLEEVGLGYVKLGQPAPTLSSGEAQRVRLASELRSAAHSGTLYLLDEPTTGLHFADIHRLVEVLHRLVDAGNTVVTIEHHMDVVRGADWVIDLGPEGGDRGGEVIAAGTPKAIARVAASHTGRYLRRMQGRRKARAVGA